MLSPMRWTGHDERTRKGRRTVQNKWNDIVEYLLPFVCGSQFIKFQFDTSRIVIST